MKLTPEQQAAIETHDKNLIVIAGAGSGKTFVLVERYLNLLERHPDWKITDLVAITFTEKAAREMRDRVRLAIQAKIRQVAEQHDLIEGRRWRERESLLDNARIGTIHSLCALLLRANPAEIGLDPDFEVLDEAESAILKRDAVRRALAAMSQEDHAGTELLRQYEVYRVRSTLLSFMERSKAAMFHKMLPASEAQLLTNWKNTHNQHLQDWIAAIRSDTRLQEYMDWQPQVVWPSPDKDKLMEQWVVVHESRQDLWDDNPEIVQKAMDCFATLVKKGGSKNNWGGEEGFEACKAAIDALREYARSYIKRLYGWSEHLDMKAAGLLYAWRDAVLLANEHYDALKTERRVLDFDDLEALTVELLTKHPGVAARYASYEFKHLMVDEFQDTNPNQREIIYRLCGIDPESGQAAPSGRLFVVGDPKQSIYAFRGADVTVFTQVRDELLRLGGERVDLSDSFRTHEGLVETFNYLFERFMTAGSAYEIEFDRRMAAARTSEPCHDLAIHILPLEEPVEGDKPDRDEFRRWEAYEIGQRLIQMHADQVPVWDKEQRVYRPFHYGDAALLFRRLTIAGLYEDVFKGLQLPYITIGGRGYYDRQEVWDLINLLKALRNPADDLALASALRSPMFGISDDGLLALRLRYLPGENGRKQRMRLWDALWNEGVPFIPAHDRRPLEFAREVLGQLQQVSGRMTVAELLTAILDLTAYEAILTGLSDGDRRRENVEKLLRKAQESGRIALGDFLMYLGNLTATEPREGEAVLEGSRAIKLMTVHASKGLEFPLVVIVDADDVHRSSERPSLILDPEVGAVCPVYYDNERHDPFIYQHALELRQRREAAESKRLFYVAATRAQEYLFITGKRTGEDQGWMTQCLHAFEMDSGENGYITRRGNVQVSVPMHMPDLDSGLRSRQQMTGWDRLREGLSIRSEIPPLLRPIPQQPLAPTRHISVSQLEMLGSIDAFQPQEKGRQRFRQSVLHDAPPPIRPIINDNRPSDFIQRRIIGEIVHRALQVNAWRRTNIAEILEAYAWDAGITHQEEVRHIVSEARRLLDTYREKNPLRDDDHILREVPFVWRMGERMIHGVIDVLYRRGDQWTVLDYKTAAISASQVEWHAHRYHLQVAAYASAVEERIGQTPQVQLYYISPGTLITVVEKAWRHALGTLDQQIEGALGRT